MHTAHHFIALYFWPIFICIRFVNCSSFSRHHLIWKFAVHCFHFNLDLNQKSKVLLVLFIQVAACNYFWLSIEYSEIDVFPLANCMSIFLHTFWCTRVCYSRSIDWKIFSDPIYWERRKQAIHQRNNVDMMNVICMDIFHWFFFRFVFCLS